MLECYGGIGKREHSKKLVSYTSEKWFKNMKTVKAMDKDGLFAKTVFSCIKRRFGESVYSVRLKNMIQEMMLKASLYNKMISI